MSRRGGSARPVWPYLVPLLIIVVALLGTTWFPFVNRATLWFGLPSVGVWSVLWVLLIPPALMLVEFGGRHGEVDDARETARAEREARQ